MNGLRLLLIVGFVIINSCSKGPEYVLPKEEVVLSFDTTEAKHLTITYHPQNNYLVYRYGTNEQIELTYPADVSTSWKAFKYSFYTRPAQNSGVDLNYLYFDRGNYTYIIYQEYDIEAGLTESGIKVFNRVTNKLFNFKAKPGTLKGSLLKLRAFDELQITEELFEDL